MPILGSNGECTASPLGQRLAGKKASLERLDAERERRGDPGFEKAAENRIIWGELLELELQDFDEQVNRIRHTADVERRSLMSAAIPERLNLNSEELAILSELLESERARLLVEIRHTDHRSFRDELRRRVTMVEGLMERCRPVTIASGGGA